MAQEDPQDPQEDLFQTRSIFQQPIFWLVLLLVPVAFGLLGSLLTEGPDTPPQPVPVERPTRPVFTPSENTSTHPRGHKTGGRSAKANRVENEAPVDTNCDFGFLAGQAFTEDLYKDVKALGRPVALYEDVNQTPPQSEPARINIYINRQKTITRIACG